MTVTCIPTPVPGQAADEAGSLPFVTVIIPCLNEEKFIEKMLRSVAGNDYPHDRMEILVMDGGSSDGTPDIVARVGREFPFIRLEPNPDRFKPHALNRGIRLARGQIVVRMDAHSTYARTYVSRSVALLTERGVDNVGGLRHTVATPMNLLGKCLAEVYNNRFGAGNATYRTGAATERLVDTVFGGCYRRKLFERIGYFDERLLRGQDREFNARLLRHGGKILFSPQIECWYYARSSFFGHLRYMFTGGAVPFVLNRVVGYRVAGLRNLVPLCFLGALVAPLPASVHYPTCLLLSGAFLGLHLLVGLASTVRASVRSRSLGMALVLPALFLLSHLAYGLGSLWGLVKPIATSAHCRSTASG